MALALLSPFLRLTGSSFHFREIHVDAAVDQTSLGHRPGPPVAAPVSSSLFQRRYEGLPLLTHFPQILLSLVGDEMCLFCFPFFSSVGKQGATGGGEDGAQAGDHPAFWR